MNIDEFKKSDSKSFKRLNPHLFAVGQFHPEIIQQDSRGALVKSDEAQKTVRRSVARSGPVIRVSLISFRRKLITDSDNFTVGFKALRDCIARALGLDDADAVIEWEYGQMVTKGRQGTVTRMEMI